MAVRLAGVRQPVADSSTMLSRPMSVVPKSARPRKRITDVADVALMGSTCVVKVALSS